MCSSIGMKSPAGDNSLGWARVHTLTLLAIVMGCGLFIYLGVFTSDYVEVPITEKAPIVEPSKHALRFAAATLNIREGPSDGDSVVARFELGDRVYMEPTEEWWVPVFQSRTSADTLGFVVAEYLSPTLPESVPDSKSAPPGACLAAFRRAASISDMRDRVQDLDPAIRMCGSLDEWKDAARRNPDAVDGVDPVVFLRNRCRFGSPIVSATPLCRKVERQVRP